MFTSKNKKSQTEMMGLVVVVILITLALLFVLSFIVLRKPSTLKKQYTQSEIAANTLYALLETSTDCTGDIKCRNVGGLLANCAENPATEGTCDCPDGSRSCRYAESVINEILDRTLISWNLDFELTVSQTDIHILRGSCRGEKRSQSQPIPSSSGVVLTRLDICG
ncbi:hypothetical protein KY331_01970 [Candidatus Woesearchaeota archaeon]|nr:hypothetical protein [Candidatus Woesearchaeota archaeon]